MKALPLTPQWGVLSPAEMFEMGLAAEVVVLLVHHVLQRGKKCRMLAQQDEAGAGLHVLVAHLQAYVLGTDVDVWVEAGYCLHFPAMRPLKSVVHLGQECSVWASQVQADLDPVVKLARPVAQVSMECEVGHRLPQDLSAFPLAQVEVDLKS
jgi:hypothetical protein